MTAGEICCLQLMRANFAQRTAFLPDTKNGRSRAVPLSQEAIRLLRRVDLLGATMEQFSIWPSAY